MKPQGVLTRSRKPLAAGVQSHHSSRDRNTAHYCLTRRLHVGATFELFRAAVAGELGPGCYVVKKLKAGDSTGVAVAMLSREAIAAQSVQHPNLSCVLATETKSAAPYLLLPYRDGISLRQLLKSRVEQVSVSRALNVARQVAEALAAMHSAGWLHGQLRPEHVLLSPGGAATLIDLTHARKLDTSECDWAASAMSDAVYAAPESSTRNRRVTAAADTYSLGIVLYEILIGRPPFAGSSLGERQNKHRLEAIPDLRAERPDVSPELAQLLRLILAKEPLRRPSDSDLFRWLAELEIASLA